MGTDISVFVEVYDDNEWVCISTHPRKAERRNYNRFHRLKKMSDAGEQTMLGLPKNASRTVRYLYNSIWEYSEPDASWLTLDDAIAEWSIPDPDLEDVPTPYQLQSPCYGFFNFHREDDRIYRVIFWFIY